MATKAKRSKPVRTDSSVPAPVENRLAITLDNGATVYLRSPVARRAFAEFPASFDDVSRSIEGVAKSLAETWKSVKPSKATVEFGLQLEAGTGKLISIFADGKGTAHLTVSLEWSSTPGA